MSISALANAAAARRPDFHPLDAVPKDMAEIAAVSQPGGQPPPQQANAVNTALNVLFGYIPTEILTLYVAVLAAIQSGKVTQAQWTSFWCFLIATPIVVWLVYAGKVRAAGRALPVAWRTWPVWEMLAGTVAYFAWAFALPNTPFTQFDWYSAALSGIAVLLASTVLGLLAPLFQRPLGT